jgi:hypothetical protein|tara:strand:+ start:299 stop:682 length:384 start_codon:yes stop_codon:yes gene_type:complete
MLLLTKLQRSQLLANGQDRGDHVPVVKLFSPVGAAAWLISELDGDDDTLFGLADLGFGSPELGSVSLSEIAAVSLPFGLSIERDLHFEARFPLTVYVDAARIIGRITEEEARLEAAALAQNCDAAHE